MKFKKYNSEHLKSLKSDWEVLEMGSDMTYFQTYAWYEMLVNVYTSATSNQEICFAVVSMDDKIKVIAPLLIYRHTHRLINRKGIYFFGRKGWSDYLNIIYDELEESCIDFLLDELQRHYGLSLFYFEQVLENTKFYEYLKSKELLSCEKSAECVGLNLPNSVDEYNKILSKHSRQNIRTAQNRLKKDGLKLTFNYDDKEVNKELCKTMREKRVVAKYKSAYMKMTLLKKAKCFICTKILENSFPTYLPFFSDKNSKMLTVYDGDTLCAFFNYGIDTHHKTIVLMAVGTNEDYGRYSPGMLALYSFICSLIEDGNIEYFDFTRGDEPYKLALGGKVSPIHNVIVRLDHKR